MADHRYRCSRCSGHICGLAILNGHVMEHAPWNKIATASLWFVVASFFVLLLTVAVVNPERKDENDASKTPRENGRDYNTIIR